MARPRRQHPQLTRAKRYIDEHLPELQGVPLVIRMLDGPPGSPRYAVTAEECAASGGCPHGVSAEDAAAGRCSVPTCALRHTTRLLLDQSGAVIQISRNDRHWR